MLQLSHKTRKEKLCNFLEFFKLPGHNVVLHEEYLQKVFRQFRQFGKLCHLLQTQPIRENTMSKCIVLIH
jgi:hypothetical protein